MKVLVTGAAGYIGSSIVSALRDAGDDPVVLDDLSRGCPLFLGGVPNYVGDVADPAVLDLVFAAHPDIEVAIHCAARTVVEESLREPLRYYRENVSKSVELFGGLLDHGCRRLIFSSSAAVYGEGVTGRVTEESPVAPASPYATTKLTVERILEDLCAATPMRALSLRYFNPVGADPSLRSGPYDPAPTHALGRLMQAATTGEPFRIHGRDWDTADGTPIRDFVHVWDVALAHVAAAHEWAGRPGAGTRGDRHEIVNVGSGRGTSVRELAETFNRYAPQPVEIQYGERRAGDILGCYPDTAKAARLLGWTPRYDVDAAIQDALRWSVHWAERVGV